ncbi:MAG TPA: formate dehydrogenase accessory sulfurtransferase FdhD [Thermoanaerobaculia bacterium]|jgi:FdhD protein
MEPARTAEEAARRASITRYGDGSADPRTREDWVTVEEPLEIRVGGQTLAVTMRTPGHDHELAAGWLVTEGIVSRPDELVRIEYCRETRSPEEEGNVVIARITAQAGDVLDRARRLLLTSSSCGLCGKGSIESIHGRFAPITVSATTSPEVLLALPDALRRAQTTFGRTGGLHAAGVFSLSGELRTAREDVGRHNAVDKVIGSLFREGHLPLSESILCVSGRASFEIVQKALAAGIPIVAAVSAPSSLAIDLARDSGMALAGFLRAGGFNLYSGEDRVRSAASASPPGSRE